MTSELSSTLLRRDAVRLLLVPIEPPQRPPHRQQTAIGGDRPARVGIAIGLPDLWSRLIARCWAS